jgi:2-hydroxychromene-2-carboxylate isomerase
LRTRCAQIETRTGVRFRYVPILLGGVFKLTNNRSPILQFADVKNKLAYERLETERVIRKHGLSQFRMNPNFPVNTLTIMRGAVAAAKDGVAAPDTNKDELIADTESAVARGAFGAPTFFVDDQIYFGKDRLRDVEETINATK